MSLEVQTIPRPEWTPLTHEGVRGVEGKVLLRSDKLHLALLRFGRQATIHEHPADMDHHVICLEGHGMVSVGGEEAPFHAGESVFWPADVPHRLWTEESEMVTLMVMHF